MAEEIIKKYLNNKLALILSYKHFDLVNVKVVNRRLGWRN